MPALLQSSEVDEGLSLDKGVSSYLQAATHIVSYCSSPSKACRRRNVVIIPGDIPHHSELFSYPGGKRHAEDVYYTSKVLKDVETWYPKMEKVAYTFLILAQ